MTSLEEFDELIFTAKDNLYNCSGFTKEEVEEYFESRTKNIKRDLEILKIFKNYISLSYIKNLISENEFSLNNFDWDIKDEEILINRIKELKVLVKFLESNEVGDSHE